MRERFLNSLTRWHTRHPGRMLTVTVLITLVMGFFASRLSVTMRWSDLLPSGDPRTVEYNKIVDEFSTATSIIVVVEGDEKRIRDFADAAVPRFLGARDTSNNAVLRKNIQDLTGQLEALKSKNASEDQLQSIRDEIKTRQSQIDFKWFQRVDYKQELDFLRSHALQLIKAEDLKNTQPLFTNPNLPQVLMNINQAMEQEYVGKKESISSREKEDNAVHFLDGIDHLVNRLTEVTDGKALSETEIQECVDRLIMGDPYFSSYDKQVIILNVVPNFSIMDIDWVIRGTGEAQSLLDEMQKEYPDVKAGLTGMMPLARDEMVYGQESANYTSVIAIIAILIMLIIAFRMWVAPVFALLNLLVGIVWAIGLTAILVGQLNIMTQMMGVILLGLGIDFSIHFVSGFTERRAAGDSIENALSFTFLKNGKGIVTGAVTTALAFLTLVISSSRGMKEMGIVTGTGLLAILLATFLVLPVFLVFREKRLDRKYQRGLKTHVQRDITFSFLGKTGEALSARPKLTLLAALILTILMMGAASQITFDQNYMNMEPKGIPSVTLQDTIQNRFDLGIDYAMVLTDSPDESRELAKKYRDINSVAMVEDIGFYLPSPEEHEKRLPLVREIHHAMSSAQIRPNIAWQEKKSLTREIQRLSWNVMEMQDMAFLGMQDKVDAQCVKMVGHPDRPELENKIEKLKEKIEALTPKEMAAFRHFQQGFAPYFKQSVLRMSRTEPITVKDLPASILDRYSNRDRSKFLVTVYPSNNIWTDLDFLKRFVADMQYHSEKATGMPPVFWALMEIIGRDGRNALLLTLAVVFLLLLLDFQNIKHALMAMIPLAAGTVWMVGFMKLTGMQFTVINVMGLPMIIGIGIDDGVHIVHRWVAEGKTNIRTVFASTGKAILLTSLTTMLAFGSMVFSIWRGFASLGGALFLGVAACFLTTLLILTGLLGLSKK